MDLEFNTNNKGLMDERTVDITTGDDYKLMNCVRNINSIGDKELFDYISENYSYILSELFGPKVVLYISLMSNPKFLLVFNQALIGKTFSNVDLINLNNYIYNGIIMNGINMPNDLFTRTILFSIGETINKDMVCKLSVLGSLVNEFATFIAITNKSSFKDSVNVTRINFALCTTEKKIFTVKELMDIYYTLYGNTFTTFFVNTMFDRSIQNADDNGEEWVTEVEWQNNDNITTAMMYLLESMVPSNISTVLKEFYREFGNHNYNSGELRASIRALCTGEDFVKVPIIIQELDGQGINIP